MKKTSILFVCMGNICRSPAAEAVMKKLVDQAGLDIRVESAGTEGYHVGELPDPRMRSHASRRGLSLRSRGRQVRPSDLRGPGAVPTASLGVTAGAASEGVAPADSAGETGSASQSGAASRARPATCDYDWVIAMDRQNLRRLHQIAGISNQTDSVEKGNRPSGEVQLREESRVTEIRLFSDFLDDRWPDEVPDPYYGGDEGFELVLDMLFAGCPVILQSLTSDH